MQGGIEGRGGALCLIARLGSIALWSRKCELGCYFSVLSGGVCSAACVGAASQLYID